MRLRLWGGGWEFHTYDGFQDGFETVGITSSRVTPPQPTFSPTNYSSAPSFNSPRLMYGSFDCMNWGGPVNGGFASQDAELQCYADWLNAGSPDIQGQYSNQYAAPAHSGVPNGAGAKAYPEAEEIARRIANEELERTFHITNGYKLGGHNDLYDAERHARWVYRMTMEIGSGWAGAFATGHELQEIFTQPIIEMEMDLNNNSVGLQAATNGFEIPTISTPGLLYIVNGQLKGN